MSHSNKIRQFICQQLLEDTRDIADEEDLILSGLLDSMAIVQLVTFIEEELSVSIPPEDLLIENFQSISKIISYLASEHELETVI